MKGLIEFLIKSCVLLLFVGSAAAGPRPIVRDYHGNPVLIGEKYKVLPTMRPGTPLTYEFENRNITCPNAVVRYKVGPYGTPLTFRPVKGQASGSVLKNIDLDVVFRGPPKSLCTKSYMWTIGRTDKDNQRIVTIGGSIAVPGTVESRGFRITDSSHNRYKFQYCTTYFRICISKPCFDNVVCNDIGIGLDGHQLVENGEPFNFHIFKD